MPFDLAEERDERVPSITSASAAANTSTAIFAGAMATTAVTVTSTALTAATSGHLITTTAAIETTIATASAWTAPLVPAPTIAADGAPPLMLPR